MDKMSAGYSRPMTKTLHPEMGDDAGDPARTVSRFANQLFGQLGDLRSAAEEIDNRLAASPGEAVCADKLATEPDILTVLERCVKLAAEARKAVDAIGHRVGG